MKKILLIAVSSFFIAGCNTMPSIPDTVYVPVQTPCVNIKDIPAKPEFESLAPDLLVSDGELFLYIARDFARAKSWAEQLNEIAKACSK